MKIIEGVDMNGFFKKERDVGSVYEWRIVYIVYLFYKMINLL